MPQFLTIYSHYASELPNDSHLVNTVVRLKTRIQKTKGNIANSGPCHISFPSAVIYRVSSTDHTHCKDHENWFKFQKMVWKHHNSVQLFSAIKQCPDFLIQDTMHITIYKPKSITSTPKYVHLHYEINALV